MSISLTGKVSLIKLVLLKTGFSGISFFGTGVENNTQYREQEKAD